MNARFLLLAVFLAGCTGRDVLPPLNPPDADVRMEGSARKVEAGKPVEIQVLIGEAEGVDVKVQEPTAEGLSTRLVDESTEWVDDRRTITRRYTLTGEPGSYVIVLPEAKVVKPDGSEESLPVAPFFVDIGVTGPTSQLADLALPESRPVRPWWPWAAGATAIALLAGAGTLLWRRRRKKANPPAPPEPPDIVALREWESVRDNPTLGDHPRALALSEIFRRYLEAIHGWKATAWTTREIADALYRDGVPATLLDRARRLLQAMDLVKFARHGGGPELFHSLDKDFRYYLDATRPRAMSPSDDEHGRQQAPGRSP